MKDFRGSWNGEIRFLALEWAQFALDQMHPRQSVAGMFKIICAKNYWNRFANRLNNGQLVTFLALAISRKFGGISANRLWEVEGNGKWTRIPDCQFGISRFGLVKGQSIFDLFQRFSHERMVVEENFFFWFSFFFWQGIRRTHNFFHFMHANSRKLNF